MGERDVKLKDPDPVLSSLPIPSPSAGCNDCVPLSVLQFEISLLLPLPLLLPHRNWEEAPGTHKQLWLGWGQDLNSVIWARVGPALLLWSWDQIGTTLFRLCLTLPSIGGVGTHLFQSQF